MKNTIPQSIVDFINSQNSSSSAAARRANAMAINGGNSTRPTSNDLRHSIQTIDANGDNLTIKIRLNDECKNGHQDFSVTADCYAKGKPRNDRNYLYGGCSHDEILKVRPDLQIFVDLHLCDYLGIPMHCSANMHYHMKQGFNNTPPTAPTFKTEFCEYYRITNEQFDVLSVCENEVQFAIALENSTVFQAWKAQADAAIELLENWTETTFVVDSTRTQYHAPTQEKRDEEAKKVAEGYYTPEAAQKRKEAARNAEFQAIEDERAKDIAKVNRECDAKRAVLLGGLSLENFIFYNHTQTGSFNWKSYDKKITQEQFDAFLLSEHSKIEGVKWEISKKA
jgi:hypothetical protein